MGMPTQDENVDYAHMGVGGGGGGPAGFDGANDGFSRSSKLGEPMTAEEIRRIDRELQSWVLKTRYQSRRVGHKPTSKPAVKILCCATCEPVLQADRLGEASALEGA